MLVYGNEGAVNTRMRQSRRIPRMNCVNFLQQTFLLFQGLFGFFPDLVKELTKLNIIILKIFFVIKYLLGKLALAES